MSCTTACRLFASSVALVLLGLFLMLTEVTLHSGVETMTTIHPGGELAGSSRGPGADLSDFYTMVPWYRTHRYSGHHVTKLILRYWDAGGDYGRHHNRNLRRALQDLRQAPGVLAFISQAYDATHIYECEARFALSILVGDLHMQESLPVLMAFASEPVLDPDRYYRYGPADEDLLMREERYDERKVGQVVQGITQLAEDGSQAAQVALLQFVNHSYESVRRLSIMGYLNLCDDFERHVLDLYDVVSQENRWLVDLYSSRRREAGKVSRCL